MTVPELCAELRGLFPGADIQVEAFSEGIKVSAQVGQKNWERSRMQSPESALPIAQDGIAAMVAG